MHDCRKTREDLTDLVFNEADAARELQLLEELERCAGCRYEYRSMLDALKKFDEAAPAILPPDDYWTAYHASLTERLDHAVHAHAPSVWRRLWTSSFSVPLPVAAAAALLIAATTLVAVRSLMFRTTPAPAPPVASSVTEREVIREVEKPVIVEKVVTRTVYIERPQTSSARERRPAVPSLQNTPDMTAQTRKGENAERERAALNGFQPPPDVKLTVIKGSYPDEK